MTNILEILYESIDEINLDLESNQQLQKTENEVLFGTDSPLDSMGLVNLITVIEQKIEEKTGEFISIADERAMSMEQNPFHTVSTLKDYIETVLNEQKS